MRLVVGLAVKSGSLKANAVTDIPVSRTGRPEMTRDDAPNHHNTAAARHQ